MSLKDIKFLSELSQETGISVRQLTRKINKMVKEEKLIEFKDFKKAEGKTGTYIFSKEGKEKLINKKV